MDKFLLPCLARRFCPPQRYAHALEHGALVLLYDPCVIDDEELANELEVQACSLLASK